MKELNKQHYIKMTTETPLSILADSGRWLSPYADYFVSDKGDYLYYVNQALVEQKFIAKANLTLIDEYTKGVRDGMNGIDANRSSFDLPSFLTKRLGINLTDFRKIKANGRWTAKKTTLQTISKDAGRLYLAGSSLKGAIRTAILFDWLINADEGQKELIKITQLLSKLAGKCERLNELIDKRKNRQLYDFREKQELRQLENERKTQIKEIFDEEKLFGKLNVSKGEPKIAPLSQYLICRDSQPIHDKFLEATFAYRIRRLPQKSSFGKSVIPQPREAISKGANIQTSFAVRQNQISNKHHLSYLNGDTEGVIEIINQFSKTFVNYEISKLKEAKQSNGELKFLLDFYELLNEKMSNGSSFIRIGSGKTFYDNSLILTLLTHTNDTIKKESAWHLKTIFPNDIKSLHPVTRTIAADNLPFGWLKVTSIKGYEQEVESIQSIIVESKPIKEKSIPQYTKKTIKIGDTIDATIIKSGIPNRLKLHIRPDFEPEIDLTGYRTPLGNDKIGEIIIVKINALSGKGDAPKIQQVGFVKFK